MTDVTAGEMVRQQVMALFERLAKNGTFICPGCNEEYCRPMGARGVCSQCDIDREELAKAKAMSKGNQTKADVEEIIGGEWVDGEEMP